MVKKGENEEGQDFSIDLLSGLRSLSLVMNEPTFIEKVFSWGT